MRVIYCEDFTCEYNDGGIACKKEDIHLKIEFGGMENGKLVSFNACQDYEVKKNAENG